MPGLGVLLAGPVLGGELSGTIRIVTEPRTVMQASLDPYAGTLNSMGHTTEAAPPATTPRDAVVYLVGVNTHVNPADSAGPPELKQINQSFEPHVLGVSVGTAVEFPNMDPVYHNVFSYSNTKRFDLGYYGKGKSKRVIFDKPGIVQVFCDIHSTMSAYVLVVDTPFVTQPDASGAYSFPDLPNGTYTMKVWHPDIGERTVKVTVADEPSDVDVSL